MTRDQAARIIQKIAHPRWATAVDYRLLSMRAEGRDFHHIAKILCLGRVAVQQRWHRLRVLPRVVEALEVWGLTASPYDAPDAVLAESGKGSMSKKSGGAS